MPLLGKRKTLINMFKLRMLIALATLTCNVSLTSCDSGTEEIDPIIGRWDLDQINTVNGEKTLTDCDRLTYFEYKSDGTYAEQYVVEGQSDCNYSNFLEGTWEKVKDGEYKITFTSESLKGFSSIKNYNFENNNKLFYEMSAGTAGTITLFHIKR